MAQSGQDDVSFDKISKHNNSDSCKASCVKLATKFAVPQSQSQLKWLEFAPVLQWLENKYDKDSDHQFFSLIFHGCGRVYLQNNADALLALRCLIYCIDYLATLADKPAEQWQVAARYVEGLISAGQEGAANVMEAILNWTLDSDLSGATRNRTVNVVKLFLLGQLVDVTSNEEKSNFGALVNETLSVDDAALIELIRPESLFMNYLLKRNVFVMNEKWKHKNNNCRVEVHDGDVYVASVTPSCVSQNHTEWCQIIVANLGVELVLSNSERRVVEGYEKFVIGREPGECRYPTSQAPPPSAADMFSVAVPKAKFYHFDSTKYSRNEWQSCLVNRILFAGKFGDLNITDGSTSWNHQLSSCLDFAVDMLRGMRPEDGIMMADPYLIPSALFFKVLEPSIDLSLSLGCLGCSVLNSQNGSGLNANNSEEVTGEPGRNYPEMRAAILILKSVLHFDCVYLRSQLCFENLVRLLKRHLPILREKLATAVAGVTQLPHLGSSTVEFSSVDLIYQSRRVRFLYPSGVCRQEEPLMNGSVGDCSDNGAHTGDGDHDRKVHNQPAALGKTETPLIILNPPTTIGGVVPSEAVAVSFMSNPDCVLEMFGWSGFQKVDYLDDFVAILLEARFVRRDIVERILQCRRLKRKQLVLLQEILAAVEKNLEQESFRRYLSVNSTNDSSMNLCIKDEVESIREDLGYLHGYINGLGMDWFQAMLLGFCPNPDPGEVDETYRLLERVCQGGINVFLTDWDGTMKTYGSNYSTCYQPAYSAVILSKFLNRYAQFAAILTAGPLWGPGICDLTCTPDESVTFGGSWGQEWLINGQHIINQKGFDDEQREALDKLYNSVNSVLDQPKFVSHRMIGSGFQRKVDRINIGLQNVSGDADDATCCELLKAVQEIVVKIDPLNQLFLMHKTEMDLEIILKSTSLRGHTSFTKADGANMGMKVTSQRLEDGNVLICGDTMSDLPMAEEACLRNPSHSYTIFVNPSEALQKKVEKLLAPDFRCFVSRPEIIHIAMAKMLMKPVRIAMA